MNARIFFHVNPVRRAINCLDNASGASRFRPGTGRERGGGVEKNLSPALEFYGIIRANFFFPSALNNQWLILRPFTCS